MFVRLPDKRWIIYCRYDEIFIGRQPPREIPAEHCGVLSGANAAQNVAVDIVKTEGPRAKNVMGVDQMNALSHFSVNFDMTVRIIDIKKHDPPGGWKKKFEFGKFALRGGIQIKDPRGFIMKNKQPENDKNTDSRVAQTWIS